MQSRLGRSKRGEEWLVFSQSFLKIAEIGAREMRDKKYDSTSTIEDLYVATIYNIKHGIEAFTKSILVILGDTLLGKEDYSHDSVKEFMKVFDVIGKSKLEEVINQIQLTYNNDPKFLLKDSLSYPDLLFKLGKMGGLVHEYYTCSFIKDKIGSDYDVADTKNDAFRYPQNSLKVKLDYQKIIGRLNRTDIQKLIEDILELESVLYTFWLIVNYFDPSAKEGEISF